MYALYYFIPEKIITTKKVDTGLPTGTLHQRTMIQEVHLLLISIIPQNQSHARRKFDEALQMLPKEKRQDSLAATGECYCTRLFQLEQSLIDLTPEELALFQHPRRRPVQRCDLQPD